MRIIREGFLQKLESVHAGISPREIIQQSSCFVFKNGEVVTYNDEVSCRASSGLDKTFIGAVAAQKLLDQLRKMPEDELELQMAESEFKISGKGKGFKLRMENEIALPVDMVEKPKSWNKIHEDFAEAIQIVQQCASKDQTKFPYICVHIHPNWVEATDRLQLARYNIDTGLKEPTLVKEQALKNIVALGMTEFSETPAWIHFRNPGGLTLACRRYMDEYPAIGAFLNVSGTKTVLPKGLVDALDRAKDFSSENKDNDVVKISLSPGRLKIEGLGITGSYWEKKKVAYDGPSMAFYIAPAILTHIVKSHSECEITDTRLKVEGANGLWRYISCLGKIEVETKQEEQPRVAAKKKKASNEENEE